ncbi:ATPase family AAA domain-containing protein 2-like isoform X2 [Arctopsyche grandis]|uniref:ATPase family AAA domain-containing protein 2-like isoform X2 n=1 Tax=Arctopsyche grandis TaxID=121162 RepID=UPI00406D8E01
MVKTRRSTSGPRDYRDQQDVSVDVWSPRALRSHYRVTRRQHWPTKLVSRRLRSIKMPRIMYPESEDTEAEKFNRRRRPVRVFFKGEERVRRVPSNRHSGVVGRQLRPLRPNNYMEESDKPLQTTESHVRRSSRQRKLLHGTFNESWITNDLKVKGYPRLYGLRQISFSESSSEDERLLPKQMSKQTNGDDHTDDEPLSDKIANKKTKGTPTTNLKKEFKTDDDQNLKEEHSSLDSDKSELKKIEENGIECKEASDERDEKVTNNNNRTLRRRRPITRGRINDSQNEINDKKDDNSNSRQESVSDSDNSSDSANEVAIRRLRRSNRTRKPRNTFIESTSCQGKEYPRRNKTYNDKTYSLRERKQPKIILRSQSPSSSSNSTTSTSDDELNVSVKNKTKTRQKSKTLGGENNERALREIQPIAVDGNIRFSSVGGLENHIRCLREMVLFPLMYPQVFEKFNTRPPKGVLFHGPPGTGKTLLARALANECSLQGGQKVSFFMRKGADCLKKWVGESERNIKLLFQQATKMKPSIIFFDEIDALAPVRSARQDQVHTSVVGTLLAEMDGLCDRGEIIVIGATNRLDAVDPALRRAGRFDRELHFPAPSAVQRSAILRILTSAWNPPPAPSTIQYVADITTGYGGSDLKALCSESVLKALERTYPQVYNSEHALVIDTQKVEVQKEDIVCAMKGLVAAGSRCMPPPARSLPPHLIPLLSANVEAALTVTKKIFPPAAKNNTNRIPSSYQWSATLLLRGPCSSSHVGPALLTALEHCAIRELSLSALYQGVTLIPEQAILTTFAEIRRCSQTENGCIVYVPSIDLLWPLLGDSGANLIMHLWQELSSSGNCLFIGTCSCSYNELPQQLKYIFPLYKDCIYNVREATTLELTNFLRPLFLTRALDSPNLFMVKQLPELPKAPLPPPPQPSPLEMRRNARKEAHLLRELRIFLRDVCRKLAANRRFYKFTKPVDLEEVTDYLTIIKQPMDLETMMTKVDMHRYNCARDFLQDIDLICANALEYNPDRTSSDKQIRHEACSLRDHAYALVEVEMDSDFEEDCRVVADRRAAAGTAMDQDLPNFIFTANHSTVSKITNPNNSTYLDLPQESNSCTPDICPEGESNSNNASNSSHPTSSKRKRKKKQSLWSKGMVAKKSKIPQKENPLVVTDEESKENKPLCESPVNGEPSLTDNDTGPSEHDNIPSNNSNKSNDAADSSQKTPDNDRHSDIDHNTPKKLHSDKDDMLFDANAVDGVSEIKKLINGPVSPEKHSNHNSTMLTSTPHRNKSHNKEHSNKDCDTKLIIDKEELETVMQRCIKLLNGIELKPLIDLHHQLEEVINLYIMQSDRSKLPSDLEAVVEKFVQTLSLH